MVWFDEEILISRNISDQLAQVARVIQLNLIIPSGLFCLGLVFIVCSLILGLNEKHKKVFYSTLWFSYY
jgi:hypothetical protein